MPAIPPVPSQFKIRVQAGLILNGSIDGLEEAESDSEVYRCILAYLALAAASSHHTGREAKDRN